MEKIEQVLEMQKRMLCLKKEGKSIGFVPTMGYLHEGHLSLVRAARKDNDIVVVSIFVNPAQFAPTEDLASYPRDPERDMKMLEEEGCGFVFLPENSEIYPEDFETYIEIEKLPKHLCGLSRPTHFRGVATVVAKLFNIVQPDKAYFGQKDYQQLLVIRKMTRDLNFSIEVVMCPIVRESDGLAMSSRNKYLNKDERKDAVLLNKALTYGKNEIEKGNKDISSIINKMNEIISQSPHARIDYIEIVSGDDLEKISDLNTHKGPVLLAVAVWFSKARLIDNILISG